MASSSMVFEVYSPRTQSSLSWRAPLRAWLPVLACGMLFALESTAYLGADHTSAPLRRIAEAFFGYDVCVHWNLIHIAIRKTGHFLGCGVFALACFRAFWMTGRETASSLLRQLRAHGLAILAIFLAACADEFHQTLMPNRTGRFSDVLLDTAGAAATCLLLFLVMQAVEARRQIRTSPIRKWSGQHSNRDCAQFIAL